MKKEKQRIKIAEWMGWADIRRENDITVGVKPGTLASHLIPDYLNDLNAVRELELKLSGAPNYRMWYEIEEANNVKTDFEKYIDLLDEECEIEPYIASAAERCESLLKTLDLWEKNDC